MDPAEAPFEFSCRRSGNCCSIPGGFVRVSPAEAAAIAELLGLSPAAFAARYLDAEGTRLREGLGHACIFLSPGQPAGCRVYAARPERCRTWPYWPELRDPRALDRALARCPGMRPKD